MIDAFISHLYRSAPSIAPDKYRVWALEQLTSVIEFDAAFWGTGNQTHIHFHYVDQVGLDDKYVEHLESTMAINPIKDEVLNNLDLPIDMADVVEDKVFYRSELYHTLFKPYGIERILAAAHLEMDSGLYTLISLYRFDRDHPFSLQEKQLQKQLMFHLVAAISHASFLHLRVGQVLQDTQGQECAALCDLTGCFHDVHPSFMTLLYEHFSRRNIYSLPIDIPDTLTHAALSTEVDPDRLYTVISHDLVFELTLMGSLVKVGLRPLGPLDKLSAREKEIVQLVCKGLTFKEVAKKLQLAPSTISNHLYRVYDKLAISSRSELAQLMGPAQDAV